MIKLEVLTSTNAIRHFLSINNLYDEVLRIKDISTFIPDLLTTRYLLIQKNDIPIGVLILRNFATNCLVFHAGLYVHARHIDSPGILKECLAIVREDFHCKFMTVINKENIAAIKCTLAAGFKETGIIEDGYKSLNNVLSDLIIFSEV